MGYYVLKFVSKSYTLKDDTTCKGQIISAGELVFKSQYLSCMQENNNWYWEHKNRQQVIIFPTLSIVHPCLDAVVEKDVHYVPKIVCNRNHAKWSLIKHPICLTDYNRDYISEGN